MNYWSDKRVLVAGGAGFIGAPMVQHLLKAGAFVTSVTRIRTPGRNKSAGLVHCDLNDQKQADMVCHKQDVVINLAATVGGVHYNSVHPASLFDSNMRPALNLMRAAKDAKVGRYVVVSSACVYPRNCSIPTPEYQGFDGRPEYTNEGYGWAKRMQEYLGWAYAEEFGMSVAIARPYNAYGPRDNFDPASSHVIASLVKKFCDAKAGEIVEVWGDGSATRSFLYVDDFVRGVLNVAEKAPDAQAYNLGSEEEIPVRDLAMLIAELSGSKAKIRFNRFKPSGQPRRACDTRLTAKTIGFKAKTSLRDGLKQTIAWFRAQGKHESK